VTGTPASQPARRHAAPTGFTHESTAPGTPPVARASEQRARSPLRTSGLALLGAVLLAQSVFVLYLLATYGRTTLAGNVAAWSQFSAKGWVLNDTIGNSAMAAHILVALTVLLAGAVQLLPVVRRRAPAVHRWSGRVYLSGCLIGAVSGLVLVWGRGTVGDLSQHIAISINALLLVACATMAWRTARARAFGVHRTWAVRTFIVAHGVLFFRLFLALWLVVFRGPVGFDPQTFSGPFLTALAFTVYVFGPLLAYESYLVADRSHGPMKRAAVSVVLSVLAVAVVAGTASAAMVLWVPRLQ
jgi:uncharacterized membrane protein